MIYKGDNTKEISFPLGGIGTGSIGLGGDGRLIDWEIFNRPSKGSINRYTHFAVRAIQKDKITPLILCGDITKEYSGRYMQGEFKGFGYGPERYNMCGFPHFKDVTFCGEFPVARVDFADDRFPAKVTLTAFNPFIPHDAFNSSIPAAFFELEIENTSSEDIKYQTAFSLSNPYEKSLNYTEFKDGIRFLTVKNAGADKDDVTYGSLTLATDCPVSYCQPYWYRGIWQDDVITYWKELSENTQWSTREYSTSGEYDTGTLVAEVDIPAKHTKKVRFVLSWNCPNNYNYWSEMLNDDGTHKSWKNYYATVFEDSVQSALYSIRNMTELLERTEKFRDALLDSTLPRGMAEAISANLSVLKSPTVLRLEDGSFYGWEGVFEKSGSCEGSCQHVWGYVYSTAFLFPELERSVRDIEFKYSTMADGKMGFRTLLPLGRGVLPHRACVDGQLGTVIKCYREWKISGNNEWLKCHWEDIKKIMAYTWSEDNPDRWDFDRDGILEGRQHHTLDMELFGPSSWLQGMYMAALKAGAEMAEFLGDTETQDYYVELFKKGYEYTYNNLFNGKYFEQRVDIKDKSIIDKFDAEERYWNFETGEMKYQIAGGCEIDQMLAQWHADIIGLGDIFDARQVDVALSNLMENNFKPSMRDFVNPWRVYCVNDEAGTVMCTYPDGARKPAIPISYCEEVMTGFEYAFAGLLASRGKTEDAARVVCAIRDRYDGCKRNPWNEIECGSNYARSMSSYALVPILSGFQFDIPSKFVGFKPYKKNFKSLWSVANSWGTVETNEYRLTLSVTEGSLELSSFGTDIDANSVVIDGKSVDFTKEKGKIYFETVTITGKLEVIK